MYLRLVHDLEGEVGEQDDGAGEVGFEEALDELPGGHLGVADGREAGPELGDEDEEVEDEPGPRAPDGGLGLEGQLVERVALGFPRLPEADVAQADGGPVEDAAEPADGHHPRERLVARLRAGGYDVRDEAEHGREEDGHQRSAGSVDVAEDLGRLATVRESSDRAGGAVDGRVADAEHGDENDCVHDGGDHADARISDRNHKRRGVGVRRARAEEAWIGIGNQASHNRERNHVELSP